MHRRDGLARPGLHLADQFCDLTCLATRSFGQLAHFVGDDRKAPAMRTRPRGFDCRVQRQQIRLLRNVVNRVDHLAYLQPKLAKFLDLTRRVSDDNPDFVHASQCFANGSAALLGGFAGPCAGRSHFVRGDCYSLDVRSHALRGQSSVRI